MPAVADVAQLPNDLTAIMRTGAVYEGRTVRKVVLIFDGGKLSTLLPSDGESPVEPVTETMEETVLRVLAALPIGDYMPGKLLAAEVELTYGGGRFNSLIGSLKEQSLIEAKRPDGYRLKRVK